MNDQSLSVDTYRYLSNPDYKLGQVLQNNRWKITSYHLNISPFNYFLIVIWLHVLLTQS